METPLNKFINAFFLKNSLRECSVEELRQLTHAYPYLNAVHLMYAKKLYDENHPHYKEQAEKTSLYFQNPLLVPFFIESFGEPEWKTTLPEAADTKSEHQMSEASKRFTARTEEPEITETEKMFQAEIKYENVSRPENDDLLSAPPLMENAVSESLETKGTNTEIPVLTDNSSAEKIQTADKQNEDFTDRNEVELPMKEQKSESATEMLFEPYHTIDYFASQGIKIPEDVIPSAAPFDHQLKRFTEWLKLLKKLPEAEIVKQINPDAEQKVQHLAFQSVLQAEIITEAMAEVWVKQGETGKAISVYEKLSLLEPAKSAYFARRIEELKKNI
ncbi:MAG: hypothetical protein N2747_06790 [Chitinophagaceae bacterium]|nr:hypothetical protein [Chitinophagaceae bacterium]